MMMIDDFEIEYMYGLASVIRKPLHHWFELK